MKEKEVVWGMGVGVVGGMGVVGGGEVVEGGGSGGMVLEEGGEVGGVVGGVSGKVGRGFEDREVLGVWEGEVWFGEKEEIEWGFVGREEWRWWVGRRRGVGGKRGRVIGVWG